MRPLVTISHRAEIRPCPTQTWQRAFNQAGSCSNSMEVHYDTLPNQQKYQHTGLGLDAVIADWFSGLPTIMVPKFSGAKAACVRMQKFCTYMLPTGSRQLHTKYANIRAKTDVSSTPFHAARNIAKECLCAPCSTLMPCYQLALDPSPRTMLPLYRSTRTKYEDARINQPRSIDTVLDA